MSFSMIMLLLALFTTPLSCCWLPALQIEQSNGGIWKLSSQSTAQQLDLQVCCYALKMLFAEVCEQRIDTLALLSGSVGHMLHAASCIATYLQYISTDTNVLCERAVFASTTVTPQHILIQMCTWSLRLKKPCFTKIAIVVAITVYA